MLDWRAGLALALPLALADLHHQLHVGATALLRLSPTDWDDLRLGDVVIGAGFDLEAATRSQTALTVSLRRARTLPDLVAPGLKVLICGLNPSLYAADAGVGFARPGNRFWPAALAAGLVTQDRNPRHALVEHSMGMTDLVKRASVRAAELTAEDYRQGFARLERLCAWLAPNAICFLGLAGWRAAVDRHATAGWQAHPVGGRPAYLMGNPSGLNAHSRVGDLADHLRCAIGPTPAGSARPGLADGVGREMFQQ